MKYDYETTTNSGVKYGFVVEGNKVDVYVNDKRWVRLKVNDLL